MFFDNPEVIGYASDRNSRLAEFVCPRHREGYESAYPFLVTDANEHLAGTCDACISGE